MDFIFFHLSVISFSYLMICKVKVCKIRPQDASQLQTAINILQSIISQTMNNFVFSPLPFLARVATVGQTTLAAIHLQ